MSSLSSMQFGIASPKRVVSEKVRARQTFVANVKKVMKLAGLSTKLASAIYGSKDITTITYTHNGVQHEKKLTKTEFGSWKKSLKEAIKQLGKDGVALTRRKEGGNRESGFKQMTSQDPAIVQFFSPGSPGSNLGPVYNVAPGPTIDPITGKYKFSKDSVFTPTGQALSSVLAFTQRGGALENFVQKGTIISLFNTYANVTGSKVAFDAGMFFRDDARRALREVITRSIEKDLRLLIEAGASSPQAEMRARQLIASIDQPASPPTSKAQAQQLLAESTFQKPASAGSKTKQITFFNPNYFPTAHLSKLLSVFTADKNTDKQRLQNIKLNQAVMQQAVNQDFAVKVASMQHSMARDRANAPARKAAAAEKRRAAKAAKLAMSGK